jgi:hypothetical protein
MEISEKVKESLRPFEGKAVLIDAEEVIQPMNPGDGLITKLKVLGPAEEPGGEHSRWVPDLQGLRLQATANFPLHGVDELVIELRNEGNTSRTIKTDSVAPTLFSKKQELDCLNPADGPSYAAVTRMSAQSKSGGQSCLWNGIGRKVLLYWAPGIALSRLVELAPGDMIKIPLRLELSAGEYDFLAGYGGGVHAARSLASNQIAFDIDKTGKAHPVNGSLR